MNFAACRRLLFGSSIPCWTEHPVLDRAAGVGLKIRCLSVEANGQDFEEVEHFPAEQEDGDDYRAHGQDFSEAHAVVAGLEALHNQAENVEGGEAENERPEDVVEVALFVGGLEDGEGGEDGERGDLDERGDRLRAGELADQG